MYRYIGGGYMGVLMIVGCYGRMVINCYQDEDVFGVVIDMLLFVGDDVGIFYDW